MTNIEEANFDKKLKRLTTGAVIDSVRVSRLLLMVKFLTTPVPPKIANQTSHQTPQIVIENRLHQLLRWKPLLRKQLISRARVSWTAEFCTRDQLVFCARSLRFDRRLWLPYLADPRSSNIVCIG